MSSASSSAEPWVLTPDGVFLPVGPVRLVKLQSMGLVKHAGCLELLKPVNKMDSFVLAEDRMEIRGGVGCENEQGNFFSVFYRSHVTLLVYEH